MKALFSLITLVSLLSPVQAGQRYTIGTTESIIFDILKDDIKASSVYTFKTNDGEDITVLVQDFYYKDGYLAMNGRAQEYDNSEFMLKGDKVSLYGWIAFKDDGRAYEYTTGDNETVSVERVALQMVYSIEDDSPLPENYKHDNTLIPQVSLKAGPPFPPHIGKYPGCDVTKLQSLPGAKKVLYMNISAMMNGTTPKPPQTKEDIWTNWQMVSSGHSPFQMNVTTDPEVYKAAGVQNAGILKFIDAVGRSSCGVRIFGTTSACSDYRDRGDGRPNGGMWTGVTAWHESGHNIGVLDYGYPGGTYFEGFPRYKWNTIMGNQWFTIPWKEKALLQWSKGEYATANVHSDYLAIESKIAPYREDDIPTTKPLKFTGGTQITIENNFGQICPNTDSDGFTFEIKDTKGHAKLLIDRIEIYLGAMLDVDASIVDESGKVMAQNNQDSARFAQLDVDLGPGKYTLLIKGGAEGTPQTGFSNYGSLGFYGISGEITGGGTNIMNFKDLNSSVRLSQNTHGKILLDIPQTSTLEKVAVYSMNGSVVYQTQVRVESIDISKCASGVYTIVIAVDGALIARKIMRNHYLGHNRP